jgi:hypothetical protein
MIFDIVLSVILALVIIALYLFYRAVQLHLKKNSEDHHLLNNNDAILLQEISKLTVLGNKVNDGCIRVLKILNTGKNNKPQPTSIAKELEKAETEVKTLSAINKNLLNEIAVIKRNINKTTSEE